MKPGVRVAAFQEVNATTAYLFGYGVYVGRLLRPGWEATLSDPLARRIAERVITEADVSPLDLDSELRAEVAAGRMTQDERDAALAQAAERLRAEQAKPLPQRVDELLTSLAHNPKIVLEGGAGVVWGCECHWAPADDPAVLEIVTTRDVVTVPAPHPAEPEEDHQWAQT